MLYDLLKRGVSIFFNLLNLLLGGRLPPFTSACIIVEEDDQYLVVELPGERIVFPGGFLQQGETPQQGAEREGYEETGLIVQAGDLLNYYCLKTNNWLSMSNVSFAFQGKVIGGKLRESMEGRPYWLHETELRTRLSGHSCQVLEYYLRYREQRRTQQGYQPNLIPLAS